MPLKKITFNLILIIFILKINAQNYEPMAVGNAHWIIYSITTDSFDHHAYRINGDTIINTINYKKIYRQEIASEASSSMDFTPPYLFNNEYLFGFIRDDTLEKKVHGRFLFDFFECHLNEDKLLYDFSLNIGDSVRGCFNDLPFHDLSIVDSINHEFLWAKERKVIYPSEPGDKIIEGVGTNSGPFITILGEPLPGTPSILIDYCIGSDEECGLFLTSTTEIRKDWQIRLYPNPFSEKIMVKIPAEIELPIQISAHHSNGKIFYRKTIFERKDLETIRLENLPSGLYTFILSNKNGMVPKRAIKTD